MDGATHIHVKGAREHNLRNLELRIPRGKLVVLTGPSGSGKSSLAFDTIYAEGYRKFMESLSGHARQALETAETARRGFHPRAFPGARDRAAHRRWIAAQHGGDRDRGGRLRAAALGTVRRAALPEGRRQGSRSVRSTTACGSFSPAPRGERAIILAPWMRAKPAVLRDELPRLRQRGFQRVRIAGEIKSLDEPKLVPTGSEDIPVELVVDRVVINAEQRSRLADSLELAFREGQNRAIVLAQKSADAPWREIPLSQDLSCVICGDVFEALTPRHFSFNHSAGACPECGGLGRKLAFSDELVVPNEEKSVREGAIKPWRIGGRNLIIRHNAILKQLAEQLPFDAETPWADLPAETRDILLHGAGERLFSFRLRRTQKAESKYFPGVLALLDESRRETSSEGFRARLATFMSSGDCPAVPRHAAQCPQRGRSARRPELRGVFATRHPAGVGFRADPAIGTAGHRWPCARCSTAWGSACTSSARPDSAT